MSLETLNISPDDLNKVIELKKIVEAKYGKSDFGMDLTLTELGKLSHAFVSAQRYGPKFEKWLLTHLNLSSVNSKDDRGDAKTTAGKYIEIKVNIRSDSGPGGLQHRFWQEVDYYLYVHIDPTNDYTAEIFLLSKEEVLEEKVNLNAVPTHGTKKVNAINEHIEYSMGVKNNSIDHQRWREKYRYTLEACYNVLNT